MVKIGPIFLSKLQKTFGNWTRSFSNINYKYSSRLHLICLVAPVA